MTFYPEEYFEKYIKELTDYLLDKSVEGFDNIEISYIIVDVKKTADEFKKKQFTYFIKYKNL